MLRRYEIVVLVGVEDDDPQDPENEQNLTYKAYSEARRTMNENEADWYAREVT